MREHNNASKTGKQKHKDEQTKICNMTQNANDPRRPRLLLILMLLTPGRGKIRTWYSRRTECCTDVAARRIGRYRHDDGWEGLRTINNYLYSTTTAALVPRTSGIMHTIHSSPGGTNGCCVSVRTTNYCTCILQSTRAKKYAIYVDIIQRQSRRALKHTTIRRTSAAVVGTTAVRYTAQHERARPR